MKLSKDIQSQYKYDIIYLKLSLVLFLVVFWQVFYAFVVLPKYAVSLLHKPALHIEEHPDKHFDEDLRTFDEEPVELFSNKTSWYTESDAFWSRQTPNLNNVMNGYQYLHNDDIKFSSEFLHDTLALSGRSSGDANRPTRVADCGAGIGRVSRHLLIKYFDIVDLVESSHHFMASARMKMGDLGKREHTLGDGQKFGSAGVFHELRVQDWEPRTDGVYDAIWAQ